MTASGRSDRIWALTEASKVSGFCPNTKATAEFAISLETEGLIIRSKIDPMWFITNCGRDELARLQSERGEK